MFGITLKTRSIVTVACAVAATAALSISAAVPATAQTPKSAHAAKHTHKHKAKHHRKRHKKHHTKHQAKRAPAAKLPPASQLNPVPGAQAAPKGEKRPQYAANTIAVGGASDGIYQHISKGCTDPQQVNGYWYSACYYDTENAYSVFFSDTELWGWNGTWVFMGLQRCNSNGYCWSQATRSF